MDISTSKIIPFLVVVYIGWPYLPWIYATYKLYSKIPPLKEVYRWYTQVKKIRVYGYKS